ncbi:protein of unknown function [Mesotoga infera]|uniref:Uncharacterized protein n=1 Tax=Mesotoga infera TaxID=1236046 RepID=A0A7Z7LFI1_9BACT|nr:protein of unknown function [Mesotoga infera]
MGRGLRVGSIPIPGTMQAEKQVIHIKVILTYGAGWSSLAARWAHNPKVTGSNPVPATIYQAV